MSVKHAYLRDSSANFVLYFTFARVFTDPKIVAVCGQQREALSKKNSKHKQTTTKKQKSAFRKSSKLRYSDCNRSAEIILNSKLC